MAALVMVTRRKFIAGLVGAGTILAVGGFSAFELWPQSDLNEPNRHDIKVEKGSFASAHMKQNVDWQLSHPQKSPIGTVFCLHGKGGNAASAFDDLRLPDFVASADLPLAVASVSGGEDSYYHRRKNGTDAGAMVVEEWIPMIEKKTNTTHRALLGWSMGGYGALLLSEDHPQMFAATVAMSPALWTTSGSTAPGAFDGAADYRANDVFANRSKLSASRLRIACGTSDPFYSSTRAFLSKLPAAETDFGPGAHDDNYWRGTVPAGLAFIAKSCSSLTKA